MADVAKDYVERFRSIKFLVFYLTNKDDTFFEKSEQDLLVDFWLKELSVLKLSDDELLLNLIVFCMALLVVVVGVCSPP